MMQNIHQGIPFLSFHLQYQFGTGSRMRQFQGHLSGTSLLYDFHITTLVPDRNIRNASKNSVQIITSKFIEPS